jgi:hypothetical protein
VLEFVIATIGQSGQNRRAFPPAIVPSRWEVSWVQPCAQNLKRSTRRLVLVLKVLEETRMTRHDDPKLVELKTDIRRTITSFDEREDELSQTELFPQEC